MIVTSLAGCGREIKQVATKPAPVTPKMTVEGCLAAPSETCDKYMESVCKDNASTQCVEYFFGPQEEEDSGP